MTSKDVLNDLVYNINDYKLYAIVGNALVVVISDFEAQDLINFESQRRQVELWVAQPDLDVEVSLDRVQSNLDQENTQIDVGQEGVEIFFWVYGEGVTQQSQYLLLFLL